jgi:signal transduction histidine kinase
MKKENGRKTEERFINGKSADDFRHLSHRILNCANRGEPKGEFAREITGLIQEFAGYDEIAVMLVEGNFLSCWNSRSNNHSQITQTFIPLPTANSEPALFSTHKHSVLEILAINVLSGNINKDMPNFTPSGSFWAADLEKSPLDKFIFPVNINIDLMSIDSKLASIAILPITVVGEIIGLLQLLDSRKGILNYAIIAQFESLAQALGVAIVNHRAQAALRERVKELTCLYGIATLSETPKISEPEILQGIVDLLPPAWQYPETTCSRIAIDGRQYCSANFHESDRKQSANVILRGVNRGTVEVFYISNKPPADEGPFLKEERKLIDTVASQISFILERKHAEDERLRLQDQLRHADRLATIGQLAAGVAHELNEPLGGILGFAQLIQQSHEMPPQIEQDINRIINSSLHAREVVKKLMIFSRQLPTRKTLVDLNKIVREGLYFLESRCMKAGVDLVRNLEPDLPVIKADQSQLYQVLVNLSVNAVQAMPNGGRLLIKTKCNEGFIKLTVEDTGIGMNKEIMNKLFIPFFTTKDVNEGTGLGLSVVHGIVTAHGGEIRVESEPDIGSKFEISFPVSELNESGIDD